ncbi:hypothetical protein [Bacillus pumilus]|nr:hypothetical protein [Bacillus pumilus]MCC9089057.1 hypothetical protein [Bacillus pumilus]
MKRIGFLFLKQPVGMLEEQMPIEYQEERFVVTMSLAMQEFSLEVV